MYLICLYFLSLQLLFHSNDAALQKASYPQLIKFDLGISNILLLFDQRHGLQTLILSRSLISVGSILFNAFQDKVITLNLLWLHWGINVVLSLLG